MFGLRIGKLGLFFGLFLIAGIALGMFTSTPAIADSCSGFTTYTDQSGLPCWIQTITYRTNNTCPTGCDSLSTANLSSEIVGQGAADGLECYPSDNVRLILSLELCDEVSSSTTFLARGTVGGHQVSRTLTAAWWCGANCDWFYYDSGCPGDAWNTVAFSWTITNTTNSDIKQIGAYYECCDCE